MPTAEIAGNSLPTVAVVIPFFQREAGFLRKSVESVFAQERPGTELIEVIVIDDGSPVSAASELLMDVPPGFKLTIINQVNGGVGAARNRGLDAIAAGTDYVAFLDSDDEWFPSHLRLAVMALEEGHYLYLSDCYDSENVSFFSFSTNKLSAYKSENEFFIIKGGTLLGLAIDTIFMHVSFSVCRYSSISEIRFDTSLRSAGEDHLFFLEVIRASATAYVNRSITGRRGSGVSIYRSSLSWDSPTSYGRIVDQLRGSRKIKAKLDLDKGQRGVVDREIKHRFDELLFLSLRNARKHSGIAVRTYSALFRENPSLLRLLPGSVMRVLSGRARRQLLNRD